MEETKAMAAWGWWQRDDGSSSCCSSQFCSSNFLWYNHHDCRSWAMVLLQLKWLGDQIVQRRVWNLKERMPSWNLVPVYLSLLSVYKVLDGPSQNWQTSAYVQQHDWHLIPWSSLGLPIWSMLIMSDRIVRSKNGRWWEDAIATASLWLSVSTEMCWQPWEREWSCLALRGNGGLWI